MSFLFPPYLIDHTVTYGPYFTTKNQSVHACGEWTKIWLVVWDRSTPVTEVVGKNH
jgi:hypothetical protein